MTDTGVEDLPRTLRREREARERQQQQQFQATAASVPAYVPASWPDAASAQPAVVTAVKMPFVSLMLFCIKLVLAAIPAMILLGVILWTAGHILMKYFPWLVKVQILIRLPN